MLLKDVDDFKVKGRSVKGIYLKGTPRWLPGLPVAPTFFSEGQLGATAQMVTRAALSGAGALSATVTAVPRVQKAVSFSGGGVLAATAIPAGTSDDFNRPDAPDLGPGWVIRSGGLGIANGMAYPIGAAAWGYATSTTVMTGNDMEASVTLGPGVDANDHVMVYVGANASGELIFAYFFQGQAFLWYQGAWSNYTNLVRVDMAHTQGDTLTLRRVAGDYRILRNGVDMNISYYNPAIVPMDENHRLVGFGLYSQNGLWWRTVDSFSARSL